MRERRGLDRTAIGFSGDPVASEDNINVFEKLKLSITSPPLDDLRFVSLTFCEAGGKNTARCRQCVPIA